MTMDMVATDPNSSSPLWNPTPFATHTLQSYDPPSSHFFFPVYTFSPSASTLLLPRPPLPQGLWVPSLPPISPFLPLSTRRKSLIHPSRSNHLVSTGILRMPYKKPTHSWPGITGFFPQGRTSQLQTIPPTTLLRKSQKSRRSQMHVFLCEPASLHRHPDNSSQPAQKALVMSPFFIGPRDPEMGQLDGTVDRVLGLESKGSSS